MWRLSSATGCHLGKSWIPAELNIRHPGEVSFLEASTHERQVRARSQQRQLSNSKLTFPSCSFSRALKGWPDFDLNPFKTEVTPSRINVFAVRAEIRLPEMVFQIVKLQPSRQRLQLNDFFCSTTFAPQSGQGPDRLGSFPWPVDLEPFAASFSSRVVAYAC